MIAIDTYLQIGSLMFDGMDQIDLTGPFEVLSRLPNSTHKIHAKTDAPVSDLNGAPRLAAQLRGDEIAQAIQLDMVYAPEPPFNSGTPESAPASILNQAQQSCRMIAAQRQATARRIAARLGIHIST
jgi:hypothetical protein